MTFTADNAFYATAFFVFGVVMGLMFAPLVGADEFAEPHPARLEFTTLEAWGAGYAQGFNDSTTLCCNVLQQQREMILEQMEPTPPGWNSAKIPGIRTDRDGVALPRPWSSALPQDTPGP